MSKLPVIFLAFANDKQTSQGFLRNLTEERNTIREALKNAAANQNPVIEVVVEPDISIDKIFSTFQDERYRDRIAVFHYGGHADDYKLLLENSKGAKTTAHVAGLIPFLAHQDGLQLIFLNGCSTQQQALDLVEAGVPAVIGTSGVIPDKMAQIIAEWFYRGLGAGLSIERAWREADQRVKTEHDDEIHRVILEEPGLQSGLPWDMRFAKSSKLVREWNLPDAAENPVFGLPDIDTQYYLNLPPSPFLGLRRFENQHAGIFFGRNSEIRKLIDKINGIYPVILYYGLSGVGKSSLLEAGLIPRIEKSYTVRVMRRNRELGLLGTLKTGLKEMMLATNNSISSPDPDDSILSYWQQMEKTNGKPILFVLDQAEESYTKPMPGEADEWDIFCAEIKPLVNHLGQLGSGKLILSFRSEYLPQIQNALYSNTIPKTDLLLLPLNKAGIKEAILGVSKNEHTADQYKLTAESIDEELVDEINYDLSADKNSPIAPTLQIVLSKLWECSAVSKNGTKTISKDLYHQIRDEGIALSDFVNERFSELQKLNSDTSSVFFGKKVEQSGLVLDILMEFVTIRNTADAYEIERITALYPHHKDILMPLLDYLVDARLLTTFADEQKSMVGLSHDTLAPVIRELYESSDHPGQRARRILESKFLGGQENNLLDEVDLAQVEKGIDGMRSWNVEEQQLVASSRIERRNRIQQQKRRKLLMIASVITVFIFGIAAVFQWQEAERKTIEAQANRLAAIAQLEFPNDNSLGLNLALAAIDKQFNREIRNVLSSMTSVAREFQQAYLEGHQRGISSVAFSRDGQFILTCSLDTTAKLWTLDGKEVQTFAGVWCAAFSADGKHLITGSLDGTAKLLTMDGRVVQTFRGHKGDISSVAFSPDGNYVLTGSLDSTAKMWLLDGTQVVSFVGHFGGVTAVAFSPNGKQVLTGSLDTKAKLWALDGHEMVSFVGHANGISSVAFSPDENYVLTCSFDNTAKLWTMEGKNTQSCVTVNSITFFPDGNYVLTGGVESIQRWRFREGRIFEAPQASQISAIRRVMESSSSEVKFYGSIFSTAAFSLDGNHVITASRESGLAILWNLKGSEVQSFEGLNSVAFSSDGKNILAHGDKYALKTWSLDGTSADSLLSHAERDSFVDFSPEGKYLITRSDYDALKISTLDGTKVDSFILHKEDIYSTVLFSQDKKYILTGRADSTAKLWTMDGNEIASFIGHDDIITSAAISPNGKLVMTTSRDNSVRLWNLDGAVVDSFWGYTFPIAFSPDGKSVFVSNQGSNMLIKLGSHDAAYFESDSSSFTCVSFSPDGKYILTGSKDGKVKLWNPDGTEMQSFVGHESPIASVAFSPDGRYILSLSKNGKAKRWVRWDYIREEGLLVPLTSDEKREYGID